MNEKSKNVIFRVFQTANCKNSKYVFGLILASVGTLASAFPFYTVYRIVSLFLTASLNETTVNLEMVWVWVYATIASIGLGMILTIFGSVLCHLSAFNALYELRMRILEHMGKLNLGYHTTGSSGAVQKMMEENIGKMEDIIAHGLPDFVGAALVFISLAVLFFNINPILAIIVIVAIIIAFLIQFLGMGGKKGQKAWTNLNRSVTEMDAGFSEYISGMEEEKIFGNPKTGAIRLTKQIELNRKYIIEHLKRTSPVFGAFKIITLSLICFVILGGSILLYLNPNDHTLIMEVLMCLIVVPSVIGPLMELIKMSSDFKNLATRIDEMEEVLDMTPISNGNISRSFNNVTVQFQDVSFSYQNPADPLRRMALDHVDMELKPNTFTALVGPSGGGKSTAGQLLVRFWDIEGGSIFIDDTDIRDLNIECLMDNIAFVFQDTHIFSQSIFDNIAMQRKVSENDVMNAAKAARCHEFIMSFPNGYDTKVGDGGHKLSGGEAQRIAIARAILKNAPIVILDEAMAFADAENELALREAMAELLKNKTVLMIAHRLYSIKDADNIYVLDNGRVVEKGTHDKLLSAKGLYTHLWNIQNEVENWKLGGGEVHA